MKLASNFECEAADDLIDRNDLSYDESCSGEQRTKCHHVGWTLDDVERITQKPTCVAFGEAKYYTTEGLTKDQWGWNF
ncbi:MAG: hypothetical protein ACTS47_01550 [Candidatus Hodgkinia cicadicola]